MPRIATPIRLLPCILFVIASAQDASGQDRLHGSSSAFVSSVRHEFGGMRGSYFVADRPVSEQIMMGLEIPERTQHLADGNDLLSGCRPHSCDEKAAAIVDPSGTALAAGLIHFHCGASGASCDQNPRLTIFATRENARTVSVQALETWAKRVAGVSVTEMKVVP